MKPEITICFDSPQGNIFYILSVAAQAIKAVSFQNQQATVARMRERVKACSSYEEALEVIGEYVTVVPVVEEVIQ